MHSYNQKTNHHAQSYIGSAIYERHHHTWSKHYTQSKMTIWVMTLAYGVSMSQTVSIVVHSGAYPAIYVYKQSQQTCKWQVLEHNTIICIANALGVTYLALSLATCIICSMPFNFIYSELNICCFHIAITLLLSRRPWKRRAIIWSHICTNQRTTINTQIQYHGVTHIFWE